MSKLIIATTLAQAVAMGTATPVRAHTRDNFMTFDSQTVDS